MMLPSEPAEYPELGSAAKQFAFTYNEDGPKAFRQALALSNETSPWPKERLQAVADELMAMRLRKPAIIVAQAAMQCPSLTDLRFWNWGESEKHKPHIIEHWRRSQERLGRRMREKGKRLLHQAGIDEHWQDRIS